MLARFVEWVAIADGIVKGLNKFAEYHGSGIPHKAKFTLT